MILYATTMTGAFLMMTKANKEIACYIAIYALLIASLICSFVYLVDYSKKSFDLCRAHNLKAVETIIKTPKPDFYSNYNSVKPPKLIIELRCE
jgi:hypothetical protein